MSASLTHPRPLAAPAPERTLAVGETASLATLPPGARAVIEEVDASHPIGRRLLDLGFVPGTPVRVLRRAPLGDPVSYELRGTRLCLRRSEALRVRVRRTPGDATPLR